MNQSSDVGQPPHRGRSRMTREERDKQAREEWIERALAARIEQGKTAKVEDPVVLAKIAAILRPVLEAQAPKSRQKRRKTPEAE